MSVALSGNICDNPSSRIFWRKRQNDISQVAENARFVAPPKFCKPSPLHPWSLLLSPGNLPGTFSFSLTLPAVLAKTAGSLSSCCLRRATEYHSNERRTLAVHAIFAPHHAFCRVTSPASLLQLPACCHLLSPPARSAASACLAKTRPKVVWVWRSFWDGSEQTVPWRFWSLFGALICLVYTWQKSQLV